MGGGRNPRDRKLCENHFSVSGIYRDWNTRYEKMEGVLCVLFYTIAVQLCAEPS